MSILEIIEVGLKAGTREKAQELVEAEVKRLCMAEPGLDRALAKKTLLSNIGYMAGYENPDTAQRIYEIFDTEHPFFGRRQPSAEEAMATGMLHGYLQSGEASETGKETAQAFAKCEDWTGLIEWMIQEGAKRNQLTVNE